MKGLVKIGLAGAPGDPVINALDELRDCYRQDCSELFDWARAPVGHAWNVLIQSEDRQTAFRAYEAATLWAIRRGLRNGSLWLHCAERYGGGHRLLLPPRRWAATRDSFLERHSLPRTGERFLERLNDQVHAGLCAVNEAVAAGELELGKAGNLHFHSYRDDPRVSVEPSEAEQLRTRLYARVPRVQLPELLMAVDSETHFSWELLGRAPSAPEELIPLYAAVLVSAMGLEHTDVTMMIPGVRLSAIRRASRLLEQERGLRRANEGVVEFLLQQPLSNHWGHGYEASSDLMSLDVSRHIWMARVDPKRRRHAIGTYISVAALIAAGGWYQAYSTLSGVRAQVTVSELQPIATLAKENDALLQYLQSESFAEKDFGILEFYLAKIRTDDVPKHADMKQRLDALAENNTTIFTLLKAYSPHARTAAFVVQGYKFRNYSAASRYGCQG